MDIKNMVAEDIHAELKSHGITLHHKTGIDKLRSVLKQVLDGTYEAETVDNADAPVKAKEEKPKGVTKRKEKLTKEQRALKLVRIIVSPNDPLMSSYPGLIFTVGSSSINRGRMIKKYVPFNNDEGWHVPTIIYDQIKNAEMQKFKTVKMPNGEKVLQPYLTKKFNVEVLEPLTPEEIKALAAAQASRGDN